MDAGPAFTKARLEPKSATGMARKEDQQWLRGMPLHPLLHPKKLVYIKNTPSPRDLLDRFSRLSLRTADEEARRLRKTPMTIATRSYPSDSAAICAAMAAVTGKVMKAVRAVKAGSAACLSSVSCNTHDADEVR